MANKASGDECCLFASDKMLPRNRETATDCRMDACASCATDGHARTVYRELSIQLNATHAKKDARKYVTNAMNARKVRNKVEQTQLT